MKDVLFIQFYSRIENINPRFKGQSIYELCNGFSDTYDLCKSKGDFLWVNHSKQLKGYGNNEQIDIDISLPINQGTVYVCAYYLSQLYQAYKWALLYPDIKFIIGGPSANPKTFIVDYNIFPSNMTITEDTVEEYFNVPNFSYPWKLELPDEPHDMWLTYSYTLRSSCYWGKCSFCNQSQETQGTRERPKINFEFEDVQYDGKQRVNLYTPSMTAAQLKVLFYKLEYKEDVRYDIYLRGNKSERNALKEIFETRTSQFPQTKFFIGVEFPSEKMLLHMNKNATVDGILKTINMISQYGNEDIQLSLSFILGWNNFDNNDIDCLNDFLNKLPYDKIKISFSVNLLTARPHTYVFDNYEKKRKLYIGPFFYGFMPLISDKQMLYSKQAINILFNQPVTVFDWHKIRNM